MIKNFGYIILALFLFKGIYAQTQSEKAEYNLKAAFIYNFTHFIEWESPLPEEFVIGVFGHSAIELPLNEIAKTKLIKGKKIILKHFEATEDIQPCQLLFISKHTNVLFKKINDHPILKNALLVTEKDGYGLKGSAINFVIIDNRLKFEANNKVISEKGFKVSSQFLKLAIIVY